MLDLKNEVRSLPSDRIGCGGDPLPPSFRPLSPVDDVDQGFAGVMIGHHTGDPHGGTREERADHDELKTLASEIIAAQQREIDVMEAYLKGAHG